MRRWSYDRAVDLSLLVNKIYLHTESRDESSYAHKVNTVAVTLTPPTPHITGGAVDNNVIANFLFWGLVLVDRWCYWSVNNTILSSLSHFSLDVDGGVPFSPPGHDDSFFYIRYPTGAASKPSDKATEKLSISDQIRAATGNPPANSTGQITAAVKGMNLDAKGAKDKVDLSKHTEPCRQYLAGANGEYIIYCYAFEIELVSLDWTEIRRVLRWPMITLCWGPPLVDGDVNKGITIFIELIVVNPHRLLICKDEHKYSSW